MLLIIKECLKAVIEVDIDDGDIIAKVLRISLMLGNNIYVKCNCEQNDWQKRKCCTFAVWYDKSLTPKAFFLERASIASQSGYASANNPLCGGTFSFRYFDVCMADTSHYGVNNNELLCKQE